MNTQDYWQHREEMAGQQAAAELAVDRAAADRAQLAADRLDQDQADAADADGLAPYGHAVTDEAGPAALAVLADAGQPGTEAIVAGLHDDPPAECGKCHVTGQPMTPVASRPVGGGPATVRHYCDDSEACSRRAVPGLADWLAAPDVARPAGLAIAAGILARWDNGHADRVTAEDYATAAGELAAALRIALQHAAPAAAVPARPAVRYDVADADGAYVAEGITSGQLTALLAANPGASYAIAVTPDHDCKVTARSIRDSNAAGFARDVLRRRQAGELSVAEQADMGGRALVVLLCEIGRLAGAR